MQENGFRYILAVLQEGNWSSLAPAKKDPEELIKLYASHALLRRLPEDQKGIVRFRADAVILNTFSVTEAFRRHDGLPQSVFDGLVANGSIEKMDIATLRARYPDAAAVSTTISV
ncbi:hypothetical protein C4552_03825 [Candidatus Parcubacteria bacterium]|nr:MAG: hypothetical protein C4552_03825 [Candidatus Parcubacteria bacterium]